MAYWTRKNTIKNLTGLALLPCVLFFMTRWFVHRNVYFPSKTFRGHGDALGQPWQEVHLRTADGTAINAWFFPARSNGPASCLTVLLCHGNAGNIGDRLELYKVLLRLGFGVLAFDYRGYGRSAGHPSEAGTYQDAEAAYQWLRQRDVAGATIIALGESLGGAVATELASRVPLGGLILQSTFTSIPDIGLELFPWLPARRMSFIRYDTLSKLPRLSIPVLVMHSRQDSLVAFHHGERLFAAANEPKMFWELSGDHNEILFTDSDRYRAGLSRFVSLLEKSNRRIRPTESWEFGSGTTSK